MSTVGPITFFNRTYDETLALLIESRNYVAAEQAIDVMRSDADAQSAMVQETTRLVARLTQMMAWLLVQKAVAAGEMSRDQAKRGEHRLGGHAVCLDEGQAVRLPPESHLAKLLDRSRHLYIRVARLDEMHDRGAI